MTSILPPLAALDMDAVVYQVTGMCVVFCCLGFLSLILALSGKVAVRMDASRRAKADAARRALEAAIPPASVASSPAPASAAAGAGAAGEPTPAQVAALAASIYDAAASSITPQIVAAIAAAVKVTVGHEARILDIKPVGRAYGQSGRISIMNSHLPSRG